MSLISDTPPADTPPADTPPADTPPGAPEWLKGIEGIEEGLSTDPSLQAIQNVGDLVKSYVNAQKMVGKDKTIIPTEKSSEVEWNQFWTKLGKPEKVEDYKLDLGEKKSFDDKFVGKFAELAHKYNILPVQAQSLMKELNDYEITQDSNFQEDLTKRVDEAKATLEKEWGDAYKGNINKAVEVIKEFGGEESFEYFKESGYGSDPKFLQFLVKIAGTKMGEDTVAPGGTVEGGLTLDEVNRRIHEAYSDKAYTDSHHPDHKRKVDEVQKYFKILAKYEGGQKSSGF